MNIPHDWTTEADSESLWSAPIRMYTPALHISVHIYSRSICLNHIWPWEYIVDTLSELVALFMDDMFLLSILLGWLSLKKQINIPLYYFFVQSGQLTNVWLLRKMAEWIEHANKTFPPDNFEIQEFQQIHSQTFIHYHWLSVVGNFKVTYCGICPIVENLLSRACNDSCTERIAEVCRLVDLNSSIR